MATKAPEFTTFNYLIKASKHALKVRIFEFLAPNSNLESSFGLGYPSYLRIQKSMTEELRIRQYETLQNLHASLQEAASNYNLMIKLFKLNYEALQNEQKITQNLLLKMKSGQPFKMEEMIINLEETFRFQSRVLETQYRFLMENENIDKILMRGPHYEGLIELAPKKPKKKPSILHSMENILIDKETNL